MTLTGEATINKRWFVGPVHYQSCCWHNAANTGRIRSGFAGFALGGAGGAFSSHSQSTPVTGSYQGFTGLRYLDSMRTRAVLTYKIKEHRSQYFLNSSLG